MDFKQCLAQTLRFEGGYSNDPLDRGGATQCGVTQATYDHYRVGKGLAPQRVRSITQTEIEDLYLRGYWIPSGASSCKGSAMGLCLFDFAVNSGVSQALRTVQTVLGLQADGVLGPVTVERLGRTTKEEALALLEARQAFLVRLSQKIPTNARFLPGWTNRVNILRKAVEAWTE